MNDSLSLSVIICTFNRAGYLKQTLKSLTEQTLSRKEFEVVIIDDGSTDGTRAAVESFSDDLPIKYFYQRNAGLGAAKNHGVYAAQGSILLFLDDDDVATPALLEEHVKTHQQYPEDYYAVLHYTTWSPQLSVSSLMHFITDIGCFLFSYPHLKHGDILTYTNFWGGRSSCKRAFLIKHGVFDPVFRFGCEDIELGYRLSHHGLRVVYNSRAVCFMTRPIGFDDFSQRLMKQGRSQYIFSTLHNDPGVHAWAEVVGAGEQWNKVSPTFDAEMRAARELDKIANLKQRYNFEMDELTERLLHRAYWRAFRACKVKGIAEANQEMLKMFTFHHEEPPHVTTATLNMKGEVYTQAFSPEKGIGTHHIVTYKLASYTDYMEYISYMQSEYLNREQYEKSLVVNSKPFSAEGYCYICKRRVRFFVDYSYAYKREGVLTPNWREHLLCPVCNMNNRMRASIHLFEQLLRPSRKARVYVAEQTTPLYEWFARNYSHVVGSEYLGGAIPFGAVNEKGIKNENLTELSFPDKAFDYVISLDVFEHIPHYQKAFRECCRILTNKGSLFFTVPFELNSRKNIVRSVLKDNNNVVHVFPPEEHGGTVLHSTGSISFHCFGWEVVNQLKEAGFSDVRAHLYWSQELGYLGGEQIVFVAKKHDSEKVYSHHEGLPAG
jgi:glycosyltransferase involved in cell wall biosynthesis